MTKCVVEICKATNCIHNKNRQCQLPEIILNEYFRCENFREGTKSSSPIPPKSYDEWKDTLKPKKELDSERYIQ